MMASLEIVVFWVALASLALSIILAIWRYAAVGLASGDASLGQNMTVSSSGRLPTNLTLAVTSFGLLSITISLIARAILTGHGPFSNMYEFAVAFSWGIVVVGLFFWWRYRMLLLVTISTAIALGLMFFALNQSSRAVPLVPALQQSLLLSTHVASAVISYGAFTIGFAAAILYLIRAKPSDFDQSEAEKLDSISYHTVMIGFPFMTLVIILGALWADIAWGSYWNWDPKETASLVIWLLYAAYLHSRVVRGWRGRKAAMLLIIGFAAVVFTFFGNYIFSGLHSYG
jgi:cytochrome c-type biogenesis protein CcsB